MIGEVKSLHPVFRMVVDRILKEMNGKGRDAVIGSGMRSHEEQAALYAQGRESLDKVNSLRKQVGFSKISPSENKGKVTNAKPGQSNHNLTTALFPNGRSSFYVMNGFAVDIVSKRHGWSPHPGFWKDLGAIAKKYGCEWGGDWKKPDPAHVQMKLIDGPPRSSVIV